MNKYKNEKMNIDGYTFASKVEAKYYEKLKVDKAAGKIVNFELQPVFMLQPKFTLATGKNVRAIIYKADFRVYNLDGSETIIDIKGMATQEAKLKRKLFCYKFFIYELLWLVWNGGNWRSYDTVAKERLAKKKVKKNEQV